MRSTSRYKEREYRLSVTINTPWRALIILGPGREGKQQVLGLRNSTPKSVLPGKRASSLSSVCYKNTVLSSPFFKNTNYNIIFRQLSFYYSYSFLKRNILALIRMKKIGAEEIFKYHTASFFTPLVSRGRPANVHGWHPLKHKVP